MTTLEQAARLALEALCASGTGYGVDVDAYWRQQQNAITALREALEQTAQQQEPVATMTVTMGEVTDMSPLLEMPDGKHSLYAAPQPAQQQEPVGYWEGEFSDDGGATLYEVPQQSVFGFKYQNITLYAAPQKRKPLTEDQIREFYGDNNNFEITGPYVIAFARAIEAAHGIKEQS